MIATANLSSGGRADRVERFFFDLIYSVWLTERVRDRRPSPDAAVEKCRPLNFAANRRKVVGVMR